MNNKKKMKSKFPCMYFTANMLAKQRLTNLAENRDQWTYDWPTKKDLLWGSLPGTQGQSLLIEVQSAHAMMRFLWKDYTQ